MDPFSTLWLLSQIPTAAWALLLCVGAVALRRYRLLAGATLLGGLGFGGWLLMACVQTARGELPGWMGVWEPEARWWFFALLLALGRGPRETFTIRSFVGAVALGWATGLAAGVVALASGAYEGPRAKWLVWVTGLLGFSLLLKGPLYGELCGVLGMMFSLSTDGMTLASTWVIGSVAWLGWAALMRWAAWMD